MMDTLVQTELDLIGAIYDAVIDPALWDDTVDRIRRHFGFQIAVLGINYLNGRFAYQVLSNIPAAYVPLMYQHASHAIELWEPDFLRRPPLEEPIIHTSHMPREKWAGNPFWEIAIKPQGIIDQVVIGLEHTGPMVANFSMGIHESMPPLTDWHIEGLRTIAPHLRRAAIISGLLHEGEQAAMTFEATLSALGSAVVLVDADDRIVYANSRADAMLRQGDPLVRLNDRLELAGELVRGQLQAAVAAVALDGGRLQHGSGIPARRRDGGELVVHVLPLERRGLSSERAAVAAVFVAEPSAKLNLPMEALQMLYGLRPAESRVFELIVRGLPSTEIGRALGIAPSTVKTHTLRLYDKVGVHSRAELTRIARDMSLDAH